MVPYRCIVRFLIWVIGWPQDLYTGHQQRKEADPNRCTEWGFKPTTPVAEQWNTVKLLDSAASATSSIIRTYKQQYEVRSNVSATITVSCLNIFELTAKCSKS